MNIAYIIGVIVGVAVGLVLTFLLIRYSRTDKKIKPKYDERQELIRGRGFKYAFYTRLSASPCWCTQAIASGTRPILH